MEPIVFISHSRVQPGKQDVAQAFLGRGIPEIAADKPRTGAMLAYTDDDGTEVTIVHVFADAASFDAHLEGVAERSAEAAEFMQTMRFEILGRPSEAASAMFRGAAAQGAGLELVPGYVAGFLRGPVDA